MRAFLYNIFGGIAFTSFRQSPRRKLNGLFGKESTFELRLQTNSSCSNFRGLPDLTTLRGTVWFLQELTCRTKKDYIRIHNRVCIVLAFKIFPSGYISITLDLDQDPES